MLILKPNCECCDKDLPPYALDARICTFECTFCAECVTHRFNDICPNCGGNFVPRPIRPAEELSDYPASTKRVNKDFSPYPDLRSSLSSEKTTIMQQERSL